MKNITIIGSGSWGSALAIHLANLGNNIKMWSYSQEEADIINKERKCKFLPKATMPDNIVCYTSFFESLENTDIIFHVTPSKFVRSTLTEYKKYVKEQPIIICAKGFEKGTLKSLEDVVLDELPNQKVGVLSGPSHAEEVSLGVPTAIVVASKDEELLDSTQPLLMNEKLRVYTSTDVLGVELGGALKNIIAFCAGIIVELDMGDNTFAALCTRGLLEISELGIKMGARRETFYGLSGLGDLIVTCQSEHSRNRRAGRFIARGLNIEETKKEVGMEIESFDNIDVAYNLSKKYNVEMPIVESAYKILNGETTPQEEIKKLMTRTKKSELNEE